MVKRLIGLVFASALFFSATAEVVVHIRPPRVVIERRLPPPGRDYVWISGYHRWDGNAYAWNPGMWQQPPLGLSRRPLALEAGGRSKNTAS
jgi:hypothetical protein